MFEIGIFSFGDTYPHPVTGIRQSVHDSLRDLLERIELADKLGLDFYGVGEHHRPDFSVSACSTILAAAASRTKQIRLGTATIVLTTDDPVRLYEQFATIDQISAGRAEIGLGSGVFLESYDLFGFDYEDRKWIYDDKIELIAAIDAAGEKVSFKSKSRPELNDLYVWPRAYGDHLSIWQTTGLNAESFERAARLGLSVQTGAPTSEFGRLADLVSAYRQSGINHGWSKDRLKVTLSAHAYIGENHRQALETFFPHYQAYVSNMRLHRGKPAPTRDQFEEIASDLDSNIIVGDAEQVVAKLKHQRARVGHDRHIFQIDWRAVPQADQVRAIHILANDIAPALRSDSSIANAAA
ncbi:alkanesulfonate monooxygenase SsuD/methylene tetrahydromethanopterin reductase-like flavin-dependent oxidoreductase (luciferase family) [Rhizobium sp. BIGb0125]|jgi:alkanesulfonate monooxygenase SsuD/methylene tetrahydromethanopterin reductase-like flavin-dependent oxidoreductase (luciferase family)|uniref:LLM class flavin-dependent oxidoreductase n=1 Tax=Rhizobium sp. BIGb0125 TaxID=2940618 RepID=UPI002166EB9D|nr:LLM class flavin-dependent oxidoreductase [Rhizobium sp. BIGb0125]MCS4244088.1 alkanesulfonate monooxygenase SsuD/methylene tetrahydromethanopterin reductase-like flavin-dependent oxidoreductase (luciferase family) [Rhizobium sp. BIGb0125]